MVSGALDHSIDVSLVDGQAFSHILTALENGTWYFRDYAINSEGTGYGEELSFKIAVGMPIMFNGQAISGVKFQGLDIVTLYKGNVQL